MKKKEFLITDPYKAIKLLTAICKELQCTPKSNKFIKQKNKSSLKKNNLYLYNSYETQYIMGNDWTSKG